MAEVITPQAQDAINKAFTSRGLKPTGMPVKVEVIQAPVQQSVARIPVDSTGRMYVPSEPGNDEGIHYIGNQ